LTQLAGFAGGKAITPFPTGGSSWLSFTGPQFLIDDAPWFMGGNGLALRFQKRK
jgi:hypothetical protein